MVHKTNHLVLSYKDKAELEAKNKEFQATLAAAGVKLGGNVAKMEVREVESAFAWTRVGNHRLASIYPGLTREILIQRHYPDAQCCAGRIRLCRRTWRSPHLAQGRLKRVLEDWSRLFQDATFITRAAATAFALLVDALRYGR